MVQIVNSCSLRISTVRDNDEINVRVTQEMDRQNIADDALFETDEAE
jgi:hypothetical protein